MCLKAENTELSRQVRCRYASRYASAFHSASEVLQKTSFTTSAWSWRPLTEDLTTCCGCEKLRWFMFLTLTTHFLFVLEPIVTSKWCQGEKQQWESTVMGSPMQDAPLCPPRLIPLRSCTAWGDKDAWNEKGFPSLGIKLEQSGPGQFFYLFLTPAGSLDRSPRRSFSGQKHLQGTELKEVWGWC